jgi:putative ABC transport system permease protein
MFFLLENFRLGLKNLLLHRLRSLLTALGIIIGVAAVIIMVAIGQGAKEQARRQMEQLGSRNILVRTERPPESTDANQQQSRVVSFGLKRSDLDRMLSLPGVSTIVPVRDGEQTVQIGSTNFPAVKAIATTPDIFNVINLSLERGTTFTQVQYDRQEAVCVLGASAASKLFPFADPIGQRVALNTSGGVQLVLTVVGVLQPTGLRADSANQGIIQRDIDFDLYYPLSLSRSVFADLIAVRKSGSMERKQIELTEVWIQATEDRYVEPLAGVVDNTLKLGGTSMGDRPDVSIKAPIQILRNAERLQAIFNFIMVTIASFSLVVGGIGIMNIMLASVTERTKEIGIRRALGAKRKHITLQFLIETTAISLGGGLLGIALGVGGAWLLPIVVSAMSDGANQYPTSITAWSVIVSFAVSGLVGIGFGMYPALIAARMDPIEALRHE